MNLFFFSACFFYPPKLVVFFGNRQQSNARAGQKKTHVFFSNARPKSNARAHVKQRKKHSGLMGLRPLLFVYFYQYGDRLSMSESNVYRH